MSYHADRFVDASLVAEFSDGTYAALPATSSGGVVTSHGGLTFGGWQASAQVTADNLAEASFAAQKHYRLKGFSGLCIKETPACYASSQGRSFGPDGLVSRHELDGAAVHLRSPIKLGVKRRPRVIKAMEEHVIAEESIEDFWPLLQQVLSERHGVAPVHTEKEMQKLHEALPGCINVFGARLGGELLAGAVIFWSRNVAHIQYMANSPGGRKSHALDGLIMRLIQLCQGRVDWLSMGISNERDGSINQGLLDYKLSFGAVRIPHIICEYKLS